MERNTIIEKINKSIEWIKSLSQEQFDLLVKEKNIDKIEYDISKYI